MQGNAGYFDQRAFRRKPRRARRRFKRLGDATARRLADRAATLADEKYDEILTGVIVHAGDEGIAALDAVDEAVVAQKIERAVNRNRRRARIARQVIDDFVGAERLVTGEQRFEHLSADRRQPLRARRT